MNESSIGWDWRENYVKGADITKEQEAEMKKPKLWQIYGPNFTAGLVLENGVCTAAAPILKKYVLGRTALEVGNTITAHRWQVFKVL